MRDLSGELGKMAGKGEKLPSPAAIFPFQSSNLSSRQELSSESGAVDLQHTIDLLFPVEMGEEADATVRAKADAGLG